MTTTEPSARRSVIRLQSIYERPDRYDLLYALLAERDQRASISHRRMPTMEEHKLFVDSLPYQAWYFALKDNAVAGACYLSRANEIGIAIYKRFQGYNAGKTAVLMLMKQHGKLRYLANIAPRNERSRAMFAGLGFRLLQSTYERV